MGYVWTVRQEDKELGARKRRTASTFLDFAAQYLLFSYMQCERWSSAELKLQPLNRLHIVPIPPFKYTWLWIGVPRFFLGELSGDGG